MLRGITKHNIQAGTRFGRLVAATECRMYKNNAYAWVCFCDCGNKYVTTQHNLVHRKAVSCGCFVRDKATTHGMTGSPTYKTWRSTLDRCECKSHRSYSSYGSRGITVCDRWHAFEFFLKDMGTRPAGRSIERINPNGNYDPGNCCWATPREQGCNKRTTRWLFAFGERKAAKEWSRDPRCSVQYITLLKRLYSGWEPEKAISSPLTTNLYNDPTYQHT